MTSLSVQSHRDHNHLPSLVRKPLRKPMATLQAPAASQSPTQFAWRGHGGRAPTFSSVEFDRQLDKIAVWLEDWSHDQRCQIIEGILRRSNYNQFQFLFTSLQPILHRDFMYTAKTHFPAIDFVPISTHTSRKLKEKLVYTRQDNFHRIDSAHYRDSNDVKHLAQGKDDADLNVKLPHIGNGVLSPKELPNEKGSNWSLASHKRPRRSMSVMEKKGPEKWVGDGSHLYASQPNIRYIDMPVRRHIQDESNSRPNGTVPSASTDSQSHQNLNGNTRQRKSISTLNAPQSDSALIGLKKGKSKFKSESKLSLLTIPSLPDEATMVFDWYSLNWSDVKRNEFLHKFLLKLDPRQHYFVSSFLTARQYKDFISQLPPGLALKILNYLGVQDLLNCCKVCKSWNALANNNDLWRSKCQDVKMEVPVSKDPEWKKLYKDNKFLRVNWNDGKCRITDLKGHTDSVICVVFDHFRLASGSLDKTIRVWDIKTGRCLHVLKGHVKGVWCLNFFTQNLLISGSYDGTIRVWNLRTGRCNKTIFAHDSAIWALDRRHDVLVTASQDKLAKVWDINRCMLLNTLSGHTAAVFAIDMSEDGNLVITGSADKSVRIWNIETGRCLRWINVSQTTSIMSVSYSQGYLACSYGETICVYKVDGPTRLMRRYLDILNEHQKRIECLKLMISDKEKGEGMIVSAGKDGRVKYWDINKEASIQTFVGHRGKEVNAIYFDELRIASAAHDNKIRIWDFNI